jgi:hypothetical protein
VKIDSLTARELDAAVARQVFGHQVEERRNSRTGELDAFYNAGLEPKDPTWMRVPYYSSSLAASVQVELELRRQGWRWQEARARAPGEALVILKHADGRTVEAFGPENEALCRAALKAVTG